jgi:hypothetical protein
MVRLLAGLVAVGMLAASVPAVWGAEPPAGDLTVKVLSRSATPVLKADKPWENFCVNLATVVRVGDEWRMWYESYDQDYKSDNDAYYCYATSKDGANWAKPNLGLVEYKGNKNNNIMIAAAPLGGMSGGMFFVDAAAPEAERYKMNFVRMLKVPPNMSFGDNNPDWRILGAVSADGIHWQMRDEPLLTRLADTQNVCFRDGDIYRLYCRMWRTDGRGGGDTRRRVVGYPESKTFGNFPSPRQILQADEHDPDDMDFYNSATAKLRDDLYLIFPSAFTHGNDLVIPQVAASRDGVNFVRLNDRKPILPLGAGFDSKGIYVCPGATPGEKPNTWWIYYAGFDFKHGEGLPRKIKSRGAIGRALIEVIDPAHSQGK